MNTKSLIAAGGATLALALAPSAFAQDFCVANAACVSAGGTDEQTLQDAFSAADQTTALDRVLVGPGTYTAPDTVGFGSGANPVELIGSGSGSTILTGPVDSDIVVSLSAGSSISDAGIVIPASATPTTKVGLKLVGGTATRVKVTSDPGLATVGIGIFPFGSLIQDSSVDLSMTAADTVGVSAQANTTVSRSVIVARNGMNAQGAHVHFDRDLIRAKLFGLHIVNSANDIEATDSVIQMTGNTSGVYASTGNFTDAGIALRGDTIVGSGTAGSVGVRSDSNTAHTATVSVDSSIVRGFPTPLKRVAGTGDTANLTVQYSDFDPAGVASTGAGTLTFGAGNINADPLFAAPSDFHLQAGSPALDAGNPSDLGDTLDFDGNARVLDADGDLVARRDIGAFEAAAAVPPPTDPGAGSNGSGSTGGGSDPLTQPTSGAVADGTPAATGTGISAGPSVVPLVDRTAPVLSRLRARRGPQLSFKLSESAVVRVAISRRENDARLHKVGTLKRLVHLGPAKFRIARVGGKVLKPGSYVAKLTAVDAAGNRSRTYSVKFKVVL